MNVPGPVTANVHGFACRSPELLLEYTKAYIEGDSRTVGIHRLAGRCTELDQGVLNNAARLGDIIQYTSRTERVMYTLPEFVSD